VAIGVIRVPTWPPRPPSAGPPPTPYPDVDACSAGNGFMLPAAHGDTCPVAYTCPPRPPTGPAGTGIVGSGATLPPAHGYTPVGDVVTIGVGGAATTGVGASWAAVAIPVPAICCNCAGLYVGATTGVGGLTTGVGTLGATYRLSSILAIPCSPKLSEPWHRPRSAVDILLCHGGWRQSSAPSGNGCRARTWNATTSPVGQCSHTARQEAKSSARPNCR